MQKFKDCIPEEVLEAYEFLIKALKNGIKTVKDLLNTIGKLLQKLGETVFESLEKLKLFNEEYCKNLPDSEIDTHDIIDFKNENQKKLVGFIINEVNEKIKKQKENDVNEGKLGKAAAAVGIAGGLSFAPGLTLLACGGYGLYKLLKFIGPKLSEKLEPYLLSDKSKEFANKLYNNKFAKCSLGLKKQDNDDSADSKIKQFGKLIWSIIVNLIIATIISSIISLFITSIIGTGPVTGLIVAVIIGGKNIFSIILNRILNFKKETITKSGEKNIEYFFDMITMVGILSSVVSIVIKIPKFSQWFDKLLKNVFDFGITKANADEIDYESFKFTKDQLKASSSNSTEDLGSFEGVKNLLNQAENLENPIYGTSNNDINRVFEHTLESSTKNGNYSSATFTKRVLTNLSKSNEDQILYSFKNSVSDDNIQTSVLHMFTVSENTFNNGIKFTGLKEYIMKFNKIYGEDSSKIGFMISVKLDLAGDEGDKAKLIKGILDASGKIIKIEGVNSDDLVEKKWGDLIKLMTK